MLKQRLPRPCRPRFNADLIPRRTMERSSSNFRLSAILLLAIGTLLDGCSQPRKPDPPPQVIPCPPPLISPELLQLPPHQAIDRLLQRLGMPPLRLDSASSSMERSSTN